MKYQLYKDGYGWAVYDPNDGQIRHTQKYLEATEASPASWADVLGDTLDEYHQILSAPDAARLIAQSSNTVSKWPQPKPHDWCGEYAHAPKTSKVAQTPAVA